jgi:hypothetical protein
MSQLINDNNQVVGETLVGGVEHAAIWTAANGAQDLNTLYASALPSGFVLNDATGIDDNGDIVGIGTDSASHATQAFLLLSQVPEPSTLLLAATGLTGLLACAWRKRK